ncbi:unnamed protein product [Caenorhabditis auriculariae]|uniref:Uncharacterized protein n=1 Tax=Caenorhabditis auriculariae TaxID=2777116 RepID=A0A8S1HK00_9PELO|nr:unnamed protein product [Caenorhabditis auriculariae]
MQFSPILSLLFTFFTAASAYSLLEQVGRKDVRAMLPDYRTTDADVGMRSAHTIGTFRGEPILTRQRDAFIDDNGVPIPLLPYANFHTHGNNQVPLSSIESSAARARSALLTSSSPLLRAL